MTGHVINYSAEVDRRIRNVGSLPQGTGCRWLLCIKGEEGPHETEPTLVAKAWCRKRPIRLAPNEVLIDFVPGGVVNAQ